MFPVSLGYEITKDANPKTLLMGSVTATEPIFEAGRYSDYDLIKNNLVKLLDMAYQNEKYLSEKTETE